MQSLLRHKNVVSVNHENGFTIIEVTVALVIFIIGIMGCYQLQVHSSSSNVIANSVGTSASWATYCVEQLLAKDYDDPDMDDDDGNTIAGLDETEGNADGVLYIKPDGSTGAAAANDLYSVSWNVAEGPSAAALAGVKQIRYIVIKKGGIGQGTLYTHDYYKTSSTL